MGTLGTRAVSAGANNVWFALGLWLFACDSGRESTEVKPENEPEACGPTGSYAGYGQPAPWSASDFELCSANCPGFESEPCVLLNCPRANDFFACVDEELYACQTSPDGSCRATYEAYGCCADQHCAGTAAGQLDCLARECELESDAVEACYRGDAKSQAFEGCLDKAYARCFDPNAVCMRERAAPLPGYASVRTWTKPWPKGDLAQCESDCERALSRTACIDEACPGSSQYQSCVKAERDACNSAAGGACRTPWEGVFCCARSDCADATAGAGFTQCLATQCRAQIALFDACTSANTAGACDVQAQAHCAELPYPTEPDAGSVLDDAGENDAALGDAGTNDDPERSAAAAGESDASMDASRSAALTALPRLLKAGASPNRSMLFPYAYVPAAKAR